MLELTATGNPMTLRWHRKVQLKWILGIEPTPEEDLVIAATITASGPHSCMFRCPCCSKIVFVIGRDMGMGVKWIPTATIFGRLAAGDIIDGREA